MLAVTRSEFWPQTSKLKGRQARVVIVAGNLQIKQDSDRGVRKGWQNSTVRVSTCSLQPK